MAWAGTPLVSVESMQTSQEPRREPGPADAIGTLIVGGDWACAHGDLEALGDIARRLAEIPSEPLHCELVALADTCRSDPDRATDAWVRLKQLVEQSVTR